MDYAQPLSLDGSALDVPSNTDFFSMLKGTFFDAAGRYIAGELPNANDKASDATLEIAKINAQTQAQIAAGNAKASQGVSAQTLLIVGGIVALGVVFIIFRK